MLTIETLNEQSKSGANWVFGAELENGYNISISEKGYVRLKGGGIKPCCLPAQWAMVLGQDNDEIMEFLGDTRVAVYTLSAKDRKAATRERRIASLMEEFNLPREKAAVLADAE